MIQIMNEKQIKKGKLNMTKNYANERYIPKHLNTKIKENDHFDFYYNCQYGKLCPYCQDHENRR